MIEPDYFYQYIGILISILTNTQCPVLSWYLSGAYQLGYGQLNILEKTSSQRKKI